MNNYITVSDLYNINTRILNIFDDIDIFEDKFDISGYELSLMFLYEHGERVLFMPYSDSDLEDNFSAYLVRLKLYLDTMYKARFVYRYTELIETMFYTYEPLWNVDGTTVTETEKNISSIVRNTKSQGETVTETISRTNNETQTVTETADALYNFDETTHGQTTTHTNGRTDTHAVAPYNSTSLKTEYTDTAGGTDTDAITGTDTTTHGTNKTTTTSTASGTGDGETRTTTRTPTGTTGDSTTTTYEFTDPDKVTETRQGNIGVTSSQNLLKQQREVVDYDIINKFMKEVVNLLCLGVYLKP